MRCELNKVAVNPYVNFVALVLLLLTLFGIGLGDRPYSAPSESRYIEIGREMAQSGDFVTPRLDYVKYFEKPPLFYWIQAEATKYLGLNPFVVRIPTAMFAVFLCLLTYGLGNLLYGRIAAWLGSLVLATSLYTFALSRVVLVDMPVSVFMVATLTAFLYAVKTPDGCRRTFIVYCMYVAAACAVLSKGLIGVVLPGAVIFLWLLFTKQWAILKNIRLPGGIVLFLLIAVPWHVLVSMRNPEFPHFYFIHEHFERYLTKEHGRYQPAWFFIVVFVVGLFPWISFAYQSLRSGLRGFWQERYKDGIPLFLFIWIAFILFFFSLSDSKLIPYILPIFPPVTVLIGHYLARCWREENCEHFRAGIVVMLLFLLCFAAAPPLLPTLFDPQSKVMVAVEQGKDNIDILSAAAMVAIIAMFVTYIHGRKKHLIMLMVLVAAVIMQAGDGVAQHYNKDSMQHIAQTIKHMDRQGDEVVLYNEYYQDLPVYLERRVTLVNGDKTELGFGASHENTSAWIIDDKEFWRRWLKDDHLMFVIMRDEAYKYLTANKKPEALHLYLISGDGRNLLFINQPMENK